MLMVIFGAGASYDSAQAFPVMNSPPSGGNGGPWRPPLADNLFRDPSDAFGQIIKKYNKLTHILPYLRESVFGGSVEQALESLQAQGVDCPERRRELVAVKFYLADLLMEITDKWDAHTNGVTNYAPLVAEILRLDRSSDEVCLVTFNYDLLLERALVSFRDFDMKGPENFLSSHPRLKIFKLHGSVNWSRTIDTSGAFYAPNQVIEQADVLKPSARFVGGNAAKEYGAGRACGSLLPAIAIPVQTKTEESFECPGGHLEMLKELLPNVTKILIIGWQAKEAHFLEMLRRSRLPRLKRVMVVGAHATDATATLRYFLERIEVDVRNHSVGQGGFTGFVVNHEGDNFLAA